MTIPDGGAPGHLCWLAARAQLSTIQDFGVGIDGSGDNQPWGIQGNAERPLVVKKYHPDGGTSEACCTKVAWAVCASYSRAERLSSCGGSPAPSKTEKPSAHTPS